MFYLLSFLIAAACLLVVYGWATATFAPPARARRGLAAFLVALLALENATGLAARHWNLGSVEGIHTACAVVLMTLQIAALPILVYRVAAAIVSMATRAAASRPAPSATPASPQSEPDERSAPAALSRRQIVEGTAGIGAMSASGAVLGWGAVYGRHAFETREVPVRIAGLPRALDGYVIVQISDLHIGVHLPERDLEAGLDLVRKARPDLVVVTGDVIDHDARLAPFIARRLADLPSRDGVAAILGNHDHYAGAAAVVEALRGAGVTTLINEGKLIRPRDAGGFALLGVDDLWSHRRGGAGPDLDRALAAVPPDAPRILLSHQPVTVDAWAGRVALQLSGHTHGGQVNPGFRPADLFFRYVAGAYSVSGTTLYVNRGFGTVGPPARVGAPPEVTRLVLVSA
jgi:predicted MPP superfamily phosphohydrolase